MTATISGVELATRRLGVWDGMARTWLQVLDDYLAAVPDDGAHWYNERATLSTLVGATWRTPGTLALEEYRCSRRFGKRSFLGRADLWFKLGNHEFVVEAKQGWPRRAQTTTARVEQLLDDAASQLRTTDAENAVPVSVTFIAPRIATQPSEALLQEFVSACRAARGVDLIAYHFDKRARGLHSAQARAFYPGVVLVARREDS